MSWDWQVDTSLPSYASTLFTHETTWRHKNLLNQKPTYGVLSQVIIHMRVYTTPQSKYLPTSLRGVTKIYVLVAF
jgi:hypothetical protein